ncbi:MULTISPECIES: GGDEF domain-containing protein [unclassified Meiothermus]|uniref:GGDEF domain-containing protein n=1 Tax=unclassified Meiothermus TaxID=370471 RepID=UPI000D7C4BB5|nr:MULTISPECIES: GGDEF domain-containing protein [unclassified Meiothermus]PZA05762.1 GGDEF domain-containing protein [Meiothermus sp. Pnk-1]RYM32228.1 GGDEF domain-containing protein [Meiothermus sp. PNK-Is4]
MSFDPLSPFTAARRRNGLWLLPLGALASGVAYGLSIVNGTLNPVDAVLSPLLFVGFSLMALLLWLQRIRIVTVELVAVVLLLVYNLGNLYYVGLSGELSRMGFSASALWSAIIYPLAFLLLSREKALRVSAAYYLAGLLGGVVSVLLHPPSMNVLNSIAQFYLANLAFLALINVYAQLREHMLTMEQLAHTDHLTRLANRRGLEPLLKQELQKAERYGLPLAVLLADLDHFKEVNDRYGHAIGDQVLREVALRLDHNLRQADTVARWGGEEFLILAPTTDLAQAEQLASRLVEVVRGEPVVGRIPVTISIGVSCYRVGDDLESLLQRADQALYRAKALGRNRLELEMVPSPTAK